MDDPRCISPESKFKPNPVESSIVSLDNEVVLQRVCHCSVFVVIININLTTPRKQFLANWLYILATCGAASRLVLVSDHTLLVMCVQYHVSCGVWLRLGVSFPCWQVSADLF